MSVDDDFGLPEFTPSSRPNAGFLQTLKSPELPVALRGNPRPNIGARVTGGTSSVLSHDRPRSTNSVRRGAVSRPRPADADNVNHRPFTRRRFDN